LLGPYWDQQAIERVAKIRQHLLAAQSRQNSNAYSKMSNVEFHIGEDVFLRVPPTKGVIRFNIKGKLSPRYIEPFMILAQV
jgi:hypothetical protein